MLLTKEERRKEQIKKYCKNNKEKIKIKKKEYYENHKDKILKQAQEYRNKYLNKEEKRVYNKQYYKKNKQTILKKNKLYRQIPEVKEKSNIKKNQRDKERRQTNSNYKIRCLLKSAFNTTMKLYSKTGKTKPTKMYGVDISTSVKKLGKRPEGIYDLDHVIPKSWFNHDNPLEIKWCWAPENLQWLEHDINMWKGARFILPLTLKEQKKFNQK